MRSFASVRFPMLTTSNRQDAGSATAVVRQASGRPGSARIQAGDDGLVHQGKQCLLVHGVFLEVR